MSAPSRFLSLLPTIHALHTTSAVISEDNPLKAELEIAEEKKTRRSSSSGSVESTTSPRTSVDEAVVPAVQKAQFLKLGV